jgi:hypothetical protein
MVELDTYTYPGGFLRQKEEIQAQEVENVNNGK